MSYFVGLLYGAPLHPKVLDDRCNSGFVNSSARDYYSTRTTYSLYRCKLTYGIVLRTGTSSTSSSSSHYQLSTPKTFE